MYLVREIRMCSYEKLRNDKSVEECHCDQLTELILVDKLTANPIHCFKCNNEVDPGKLALKNELIDLVKNWQLVYKALYSLYLDSDEYEHWAIEKLTDIKGQVNVDGLRVAKELSKIHKTYYWWFYQVEHVAPIQCPSCNQNLKRESGELFAKCERCLIVL